MLYFILELRSFPQRKFAIFTILRYRQKRFRNTKIGKKIKIDN